MSSVKTILRSRLHTQSLQLQVKAIKWLALFKAQICMISFKHAHRYLVFIKHSYMLTDRTASAVCRFESQYTYEYILETETPLSELKTFPNCKET